MSPLTPTDDPPSQNWYHALDQTKKEIRLLHIEPGQIDDSIRCTFEHAALSQQPPPLYETISYVWGDPSLRGSLYLHDQLIDVPINTELVLKRMRYADRKRVVWVDAVCINQTDVAERSSQVAMMAEIYGMTTTNLIWLGEDDEDIIARANASISTILADMRAKTEDLQTLTKHIYGTWGDMLFSNAGISAEVDWNSVRQYYASPWFTRLWIVQEAALPAKSICHRGKLTRPLEDVLRAALWILHNISTMPPLMDWGRGIKGAAGIFAYADHDYGRHEILYSRGKRATTTELLIGSLSGYDAFDARDHVFAMLGLYRKYMRSSELPTALMPDYNASVSTVYREAVRLIITEEANLDILQDAIRRPHIECTGEWPSWVPRWDLGTDEYSNHREVNIFGACAHGKVGVDVSRLGMMDDANILTVKGINLGFVSDFTPEFERRQFVVEGATAMRDMISCAEEVDRKSRPESQMHPDRLPHTLITGQDGYIGKIKECRSAELYAAFRHYIFDLDRFPDGLDDVSEDIPVVARDAANYSQALASACFGRCIFSVSSGHLGRGPSTIQVRDIVAILFGSSYPFVLRPLDLQDQKFEIIGYCWVYGVMEGQAVHEFQASEEDEVTFHLC